MAAVTVPSDLPTPLRVASALAFSCVFCSIFPSTVKSLSLTSRALEPIVVVTLWLKRFKANEPATSKLAPDPDDVLALSAAPATPFAVAPLRRESIHFIPPTAIESRRPDKAFEANSDAGCSSSLMVVPASLVFSASRLEEMVMPCTKLMGTKR